MGQAAYNLFKVTIGADGQPNDIVMCRRRTTAPICGGAIALIRNKWTFAPLGTEYKLIVPVFNLPVIERPLHDERPKSYGGQISSLLYCPWLP